MKTQWFVTLAVAHSLGNLCAQDSAIRIFGSDTMLLLNNLEFAKAYKKHNPAAEFEIRGEGSSTGIKALIEGKVELAASSRVNKASEIAMLKEKRGVTAKEIIAAHNPNAIYLHKDNPLESITLAQLKQVFLADRCGYKFAPEL